MAARVNKIRHDEQTRAKIQASQLVNRLQGYALSHSDPQTGDPISLSQHQIKAIEVLLRKVLPDLASIDATLSGPDGGPVVFKTVYEAKP